MNTLKMKGTLFFKYFGVFLFTLLVLFNYCRSDQANSTSSNNATNEADPSAGYWELVWNAEDIFFDNQPGARIMHCTFEHNGTLGVYGGMQMNGLMLSDIWLFLPDTKSWEKVVVEDSSQTMAHAGHVCFQAHGVLYVFGGYAQVSSTASPLASDVLWTLNLSNPVIWEPHTLSSDIDQWPTPRVFTDGAYAPLSNRFVVFGGAASNANGEVVDLDDTWAYDLTLGTWEELSAPSEEGKSPPGRYNHACAMLSYGESKGLDERLALGGEENTEKDEYFVVYGGHRYSAGFFMGETLDDVWLLNLGKGTWENKKAGASLKRSQHSMVQHAGRLWVFGGMALVSAYSYIFNDVLALDPAQGIWLKLDQDERVGSFLDEAEGPAELFDHHAEVVGGFMYVFGGRHFVRSLWSGSVWRLDLDSIDDSRLSPARPEFLTDFSSYALESMLVSLLVSLLALALAIAFMLCHYHRRDGLLRAVLQQEIGNLMAGDNNTQSRRRRRGVAQQVLQELPIVTYSDALAKLRNPNTGTRTAVVAVQPEHKEPSPNASSPETADQEIINSDSKDNQEGMDQAQTSLGEIEMTTFSEDQEDCCAICLIEYEDSTEVKLLECSHFFHAACIDEWLRVNQFCPLCKAQVGRASSRSSRRRRRGQNNPSSRQPWLARVLVPQRFAVFTSRFQESFQNDRHNPLDDNEENSPRSRSASSELARRTLTENLARAGFMLEQEIQALGLSSLSPSPQESNSVPAEIDRNNMENNIAMV
mmetsp:Transcript_25561/g.33430  ORF Transcript_25561/g.33430 Transcript_25561/m.33430 type:complete len:758 (+) Transcript_25561:43-2316(+)|eukprot:CAMPEP_0117776944 /NCGR_PEP_ID=MMETSP0948-20121206/86_1 /TAXON_ID=44440 /ORGANISM="Chattonella subsalsa, Strain CCMP2191" /LENGTH=757 /DNA_ID=CAMNT_0005603949 /DNA_START=42 /DNA_END=2315 /DNA_ORIENTATION=+